MPYIRIIFGKSQEQYSDQICNGTDIECHIPVSSYELDIQQKHLNNRPHVQVLLQEV